MKKGKTTTRVEQKPAGGISRAAARYIRISPRKVRPVINALRWKQADQALAILMGMSKKAARLAEKVLHSALANAKQKGLDRERLYISDIRADGGFIYKRIQPRSMGRADRKLRRTTHLSLVLTEKQKPYRASGDAEEEGRAAQKTKTGKILKAKKAGSRKKTATAGAK